MSFWRFTSKEENTSLVFPSGLGYQNSNDRVLTPKVNAVFGSIPILTKEISNIKNGEPIPMNQFSDLVSPTGNKSNFLEGLNSTINYNNSKKYS
tara:strand:+ start:5296 stop:5577 length:282 start_codon:yes stop_codon:yes gene_type:complete